MKTNILNKDHFWEKIAEHIISFRPKNLHDVTIDSHYDFIIRNLNYLDSFPDLKDAIVDKINNKFIPNRFKTIFDNHKEVYCVFENESFQKYLVPIINAEMCYVFSKQCVNFLSILKESNFINNYNINTYEQNNKICKAFVSRFQSTVSKNFNFNFNLSSLNNVYFEEIENFTNKSAIILYSYQSTSPEEHVRLFKQNLNLIDEKNTLLSSKINNFIIEKKEPKHPSEVKIFGKEKNNIFEDFNNFLNQSYQKSLYSFFQEEIFNHINEIYELGITNNHDPNFIDHSKQEIKSFIDNLNNKYQLIFSLQLEKYYIKKALFSVFPQKIFTKESHNIFNKKNKDGSYYYGSSQKGEDALMKQLSTYLDYVNIFNEMITEDEKNKYVKAMSSNLYNSIHKKIKFN